MGAVSILGDDLESFDGIDVSYDMVQDVWSIFFDP
jgi:hypothetical protein